MLKSISIEMYRTFFSVCFLIIIVGKCNNLFCSAVFRFSGGVERNHPQFFLKGWSGMKRVKITPEIRQSIRVWSRDSGLTQTEIGDIIGVSNPTVNSWINGKILSIRPEHWDKLFPYIRDLLGKETASVAKSSPENPNAASVSTGPGTTNAASAMGNYWSRVLRKVLSSQELSSDEKVKFLKVITDGKE